MVPKQGYELTIFYPNYVRFLQGSQVYAQDILESSGSN